MSFNGCEPQYQVHRRLHYPQSFTPSCYRLRMSRERLMEQPFSSLLVPHLVFDLHLATDQGSGTLQD